MEITLIKKNDKRIDRTTGKPIERLRVVAYARVSTDSEEQLNSYESQKTYYREKIMSNSNWTFIDIYADEGISGTQDYKRENFMLMIDDAINNKFDLILTKSISRFARNTLDTLKYVRLLREHNVAIQFEEEGINTMEMSGELLLTVLSSVAQQESETISSHVKLGLKMKSERGELVGFNNCYGYSYDSKTNKMEVIEEEAEIIRYIFKQYTLGHGCDYIARRLDEMNVKPRRKDKWSPGTILGIVKNEKYVGDVIQGKTYTIDAITHKRQRNFGESEKYYMKNHHEAIVSRDIFDQVQEELKRRAGRRPTGRRIGNICKKYALSCKIKCGCCGFTFCRRSVYGKNETIPIWKCNNRVLEGKRSCGESKSIKEEVILKSFVDVYNVLCNAKDINIEQLLNNISKAMKSDNTKEKINGFIKKKKDQENKKSKLLDLLLRGVISEEDYHTKEEVIIDKITKFEDKIEQYSLLLEDDNKIDEGINKIKKALNLKKILSEFDEEVFEALVDYIIIGGEIDGQSEPCMIRFICKSENDVENNQEKTNEFILRNKKIINGESEDLYPVLDIYSNQQYHIFEKAETGRLVKKTMTQIRVRLELKK